METVFIIHGSTCSRESYWIPYLKKNLKEKRYEVFVPQFPTPYGQNFKSWSKVLKELKKKISNSIVVAYSTGAIFMARYLIKNKIHIKKYISVSGFNNYHKENEPDINAINDKFFIKSAKKLEKYADYRTAFYSNNDEHINIDSLKLFAKEINAKEVFIQNAGHFNSSSKYGAEFPELLKEIKNT